MKNFDDKTGECHILDLMVPAPSSPLIPWSLLLILLAKLAFLSHRPGSFHCLFSFGNINSPRLVLPFHSDPVVNISQYHPVRAFWVTQPNSVPLAFHHLTFFHLIVFVFFSCLTLFFSFRTKGSIRRETLICLWPW